MPTLVAGQGQAATGGEGAPAWTPRSLGSAWAPLTSLHPYEAPRPNFSRSPAERPRIGRRVTGAGGGVSRWASRQNPRLGGHGQIVASVARTLL